MSEYDLIIIGGGPIGFVVGGFLTVVGRRFLPAGAVKEFLTTPIDWYFHLALNTSRHVAVAASSATYTS